MNLKKINKMIKSIQFLFFIILIVNCKRETKKNDFPIHKEEQINNMSVPIKEHSEQGSENCYDYLTELVRSCNFPFSEWKISKEKVNLLIDNDDENIIKAKLFYETSGTGTIGWIEYDKKNGKLFNTSANLDRPIELKYELKWKNLFDSCLFNKGNDKLVDENLLKKVYIDCEELSLPIKYDYEVISEEKGFKSIDKEYYNLFPIQHQDNYKMIRLPIINENVKPIILITYNENGQSSWYLFTLDNQYKPISNIILYTSEELGNGISKSTIYSVYKDYKISINQLLNDKVISKKDYTISEEGYIK